MLVVHTGKTGSSVEQSVDVQKLKTCQFMTAHARCNAFAMPTCVDPWVVSIHEGTGANMRMVLAGRRDYPLWLAARYISISVLFDIYHVY